MLVTTYFLHTLGPAAERRFGLQRFLTAYAVSGVAGTATSLARNPAPSLGASGAVFGLGGALVVIYAQLWPLAEFFDRPPPLASLGQKLFLNLMITWGNPNINVWSNIGGLLGGALTAYLFGPRFERFTTEEGIIFRDTPILPVFPFDWCLKVEEADTASSEEDQ